MQLKTFISPLVRPTIPHIEAQSQQDRFVQDRSGRNVCWVDELFSGGIVIPDGVLSGEEPPLLWVIQGPPGSGKTTFTLELCRNLASKPQSWLLDYGIEKRVWGEFAELMSRGGIDPTRVGSVAKSLAQSDIHTQDSGILERLYSHGYSNEDGGFFVRSLYVSLESPARRIMENMRRFGWPMEGVQELKEEDKPNHKAAMWIAGLEYLERVLMKPAEEFINQLRPHWRKMWGDGHSPGVIVIDSLNALRNVEEWRAVEAIRTGLATKAWLMIVLRDADPGVNSPWEYLADIITRMDVVERQDYLLGRFRIVKAKNQEHATGNHRMKVYGNPNLAGSGPASSRTTTYLNEGGLYIFPSVHRLLSASWRSELTQSVTTFPMPLAEMDVLIGTDKIGEPGLIAHELRPGLPASGCSVFIGERGLLKSYVAYYWLLKQLETYPDIAAMLLSMRDDEKGAIATLQRIADRERISIDVRDAIYKDRLRIHHFKPGYMPPEEFMHNVLIRIDEKLRCCVVNGIDHIPARLPLCAGLDVFVPALAKLLSNNGVTTVFAATEEEEALAHIGLLPMADFLLRFSPYNNEVNEVREQLARVTAERVPGGGTGKRTGILFRQNGELKFEQR